LLLEVLSVSKCAAVKGQGSGGIAHPAQIKIVLTAALHHLFWPQIWSGSILLKKDFGRPQRNFDPKLQSPARRCFELHGFPIRLLRRRLWRPTFSTASVSREFMAGCP
jgi:hypothetical protein